MALPIVREKTSLVIAVYIVGLLLQAIYLPFLARLSPSFWTPSIDAQYSWVWDRPAYYDSAENKNISVAELQDLREKNIVSPKPSNWLLDKLDFEQKDKGLPSDWVKIYGIDYKRLFLSLLIWTIFMRGIYIIVKKNEKTRIT